jgi:hypothetical protein
VVNASIPLLTTKPISFVPVTELDSLPGIEWLIQDVLPSQGLATLYGEPGHGKSFVSIDWANHIAAGLPWHGKEVQKGTVVYIVAEGSRGMRDRMKAWRMAHPDADVSQSLVVLEPIMLHDPPALNRFINAVQKELKDTKPALIIMDTLAQNFVGGDENSAQDMGVWLHGARILQEKFASTVLIVHHAARGTGRERGSTALRGASDAMIHMRRPSEKVNSYKMVCTKMKDGECFKDTLFIIDPVPGSKSAVLRLAPAEAGIEVPSQTPVGDPLDAAVATVAASSATLTQAVKELMGQFPELTQSAAKSRIWRAREKAAATSATDLPDLPEVSLH